MRAIKVAAAAVLLSACASATPTPTQQVGVGTYEAALQLCIAHARETDAGELAAYNRCAHDVDVAFGRVDAGR